MSDSEEEQTAQFSKFFYSVDCIKNGINKKFSDLTNFNLPSKVLNPYSIADWMNRQINGTDLELYREELDS